MPRMRRLHSVKKQQQINTPTVSFLWTKCCQLSQQHTQPPICYSLRSIKTLRQAANPGVLANKKKSMSTIKVHDQLAILLKFKTFRVSCSSRRRHEQNVATITTMRCLSHQPCCCRCNCLMEVEMSTWIKDLKIVERRLHSSAHEAHGESSKWLVKWDNHLIAWLKLSVKENTLLILPEVNGS